MNSGNIKIIDTHTHLSDALFRDDRAIVLADSRASGVIGVIAVGETLKDSELNLKLADVHPELLPAAGLYPGVVDKKQAEEVEALIVQHATELVAIGEVGLDYWIVKEDAQQEIQREIFSRFIELSIELNLPLNVHSRSAGKYAIEMLLQKGAVQVQMHAFDGNAASAQKAVEAGYYFSIPPSIVRSKQKQKLVKKLPCSAILLETDSPVLGPDPDERNVPVNIMIAAEAIAHIKEIPIERVLEYALENTERLYGKTGAIKKLRYSLKDAVDADSQDFPEG